MVSLAAVSLLQFQVLAPESRRRVYIGATLTCDLSSEDSHHDPQAHNNNPRNNKSSSTGNNNRGPPAGALKWLCIVQGDKWSGD